MFQAGVHTVFLILPIPETSGFAVSVVVYGNVESTRSVDRHVERVDRYVGRSLHEDCVPHHLGRLSRCQVYDRDVRNAGLPMRRKLRQVEIYYALSGSIRRGLVSRPRSPSVRRGKYKLVSFIRIGPHPNPLGSWRDWQRVQYLFVVCGVTPAEPELTNRERQQHRCYQTPSDIATYFFLPINPRFLIIVHLNYPTLAASPSRIDLGCTSQIPSCLMPIMGGGHRDLRAYALHL